MVSGRRIGFNIGALVAVSITIVLIVVRDTPQASLAAHEDMVFGNLRNLPFR